MYLITIQHKSVWEELQRTRSYICRHSGPFREQYPVSYSELASLIWVDIPIFAWYRVNHNETLSLSDIPRMMEMTEFSGDYFVLELNVSDSAPLLTNFYDWSDLIFTECEGHMDNETRKILWKNILDVNEQSVEIQAILPYLVANWVTDVHRLRDLL